MKRKPPPPPITDPVFDEEYEPIEQTVYKLRNRVEILEHELDQLTAYLFKACVELKDALDCL
jgi:hypothetical protein